MKLKTILILVSLSLTNVIAQDCNIERFRELQKIGIKNMNETEYEEYSKLREVCIDLKADVSTSSDKTTYSTSRNHTLDMKTGFWKNHYYIDSYECDKNELDQLLYSSASSKGLAISSKTLGIMSRILLSAGLLTTCITSISNAQNMSSSPNLNGLFIGIGISSSSLIFLIAEISTFKSAINSYNTNPK